MQSIHNQKNSQGLAVAVTIILEVLFAFLGAWTLYDVFISWGLIPAIIIGGLTGLTLFLLYLYVFIYREYALDAAKLFSAKRGEDPVNRLTWALFLSIACVLMDSAFNANRMIGLPINDGFAKFFIWAGLQIMVFVPFALGKLVHAHVNVVDVQASRQSRMIDLVDDQLYKALEQILPTLNAAEMLQLKSGNLQVLEDRLNAIEAERKAIQAPAPVSPLAAALDRWAQNQNDQPQPEQPQLSVKEIVAIQKKYDAEQIAKLPPEKQDSYYEDLARSVGGVTASPLSQKSSQNGHQ